MIELKASLRTAADTIWRGMTRLWNEMVRHWPVARDRVRAHAHRMKSDQLYRNTVQGMFDWAANLPSLLGRVARALNAAHSLLVVVI